jgi:hypothetical protein
MNNLYGMGGQTMGETMGLAYWRGWVPALILK